MEKPNETTTNLVAKPATTKKMVRIQAQRAIRFKDESGKNVTLNAGDFSDVPEDVASEFCDRTFDLGYNRAGEWQTSDWTEKENRNRITRAKRVTVAS